jgi:hypothetical protein
MAVPTQFTSCCNLLAPVRQSSSNSRNAKMYFSQAQLLFIAERYMAPLSYITCQNEFRDTFLGSPVPNKSAVSCLANRFLLMRELFTRSHKNGETKECMHRWTQCTFPVVNITPLVFVLLQWFLTKRTRATNGFCDLSIVLYYPSQIVLSVTSLRNVDKLLQGHTASQPTTQKANIGIYGIWSIHGHWMQRSLLGR